PGSTVSALRRRALANSLKTSNAISLPGLTSLNRSGFDAIILYHFDAAELAPSTASKADICSAKSHVRFTPESGHVQCTRACPLWAKSGLMQRSKNDRYSITLVGAGELLFAKNGLIRDPITAISRR